MLSVDGAPSVDRILDLIEADLASGPDFSLPGKRTRRIKQYLRDRRLWAQRLAGLWLTAEGRAKRAFLRKNFPTLSLWSMDYPTLGNSIAQIELHMRQFPPFDVPKLQKRIDDIALATSRYHGMVVKARRDGLVEIVHNRHHRGVD